MTTASKYSSSFFFFIGLHLERHVRTWLYVAQQISQLTSWDPHAYICMCVESSRSFLICENKRVFTGNHLQDQKMADNFDFATCSICMEAYDCEHRIPKSLDCRHSLCAVCLTSQLDIQKSCPICRQVIDNPDKVSNDLTMIAFLDREQEKIRIQEQKTMREKLLLLIDETESEYKSIEDTIHQFQENKLQIFTDKSHSFEEYAKYLFKKSLDSYNWEAVAFQYERELDSNLNKVQISLALMWSLLEQKLIEKESFEKCQTEASRAADRIPSSQNCEKRLWEVYREQLVKQFSKISKVPMGENPEFVSGEKK